MDVEVDDSDNIFVSDAGVNDRVQVFDSGGVFAFAFGSHGDGDGQFNSVTGMGLDEPRQRIVVGDGNGRLQVFRVVPETRGFCYEDFSSIEGLNLLNAASQHGDVLRLTPSTPGTHGSAVYSQKQRVELGFEASFDFRISELGGRGADRIAFGVRETVNGVFAPGGIGIEIDTYRNQWDPDGNHISLYNTTDGLPDLAVATLPFDASDGNVHTVHVSYDGTEQRMRIFVDNEESPIIDVPLDLASEIALDNGKAWAVLSGETGLAAWEVHDVHRWCFQSIPEPSTLLMLLAGLIGIASCRR